ncbi:MAG TPA: hypothetical protein VF980_04675 [Thermoanaerobaculia bacterium]
MTNERSAGLIAFGALQILIGLACAALALSIAAGSELMVRQGPGGGAAVASGLVVYGLTAVYFIAVGVGSIRRRRWARALSVVVSAIWLAAGVVATLLLIVVLPVLRGRASIGAIVGGAIVFAIVLPLIIFLFYRQEAVRRICELADFPRWTDRVPLPVLAVVVVLAFASVTLFANLANPAIAIFGAQMTGAPAAVTLLALAILCAWLAIQLYRLRESAWWTLVLLQVIGCVAAATALVRGTAAPTSAGIDLSDVYRSPLFVTVLAASWIAYFAYLLFIRRYFAIALEPRTRREDTAERFT